MLLSKLIASTREELQIDLSNVFAWSDSTISLSWIHTSLHQLKTYVANRVVAIINHVPAQHWRHVPSADNPADLGSRGCTASTLTKSKLWWTGLPWLKQGPDNWPLQERQQAAVSELKDSALITGGVTELIREVFFLCENNQCSLLVTQIRRQHKEGKVRSDPRCHFDSNRTRECRSEVIQDASELSHAYGVHLINCWQVCA